MTPTRSTMRLPTGYGDPQVLLDWEPVWRRLRDATLYWLATTRPDGRPHLVPMEGFWHDGLWYFGGGPDAIHQRNIAANPRIAISLEDARAAVIAEGTVETVMADDELARRLTDASNAKYPQYRATPVGFLDGVSRLRPALVLAWNDFPADATRFTF